MQHRLPHRVSPLVRLLRDPGGALAHALHLCLHAFERALPFLAAATAAVLAFAVLLAALRRRRAERLASGARLVRVAVPPEVDPQAALLLWKTLHDLLRPRLARLLRGQPHLAWEISADRTGNGFRLWLPGSITPGLVERALAAAWPGISVSADPAGSAFASDGALACCELALSGPEWRLLGGAGDGGDPLRLVLGQLAGLAEGERALVQLLLRPATVREQRRLLAVARRLKAGQPTRPLARLLDLVDPTPAPPRRPPADPALAAEVREVLRKAAQPLFRVALRLAVAAPREEQARGRIHALCAAFAAYEGSVGLRRRRLHAGADKLERRALGRGFLLSASEVAALAHLPEPEQLPGLVRAGARSVAPPPALPAEGKPLGRSLDGERVALAVADARYHLHLLGPTGVGKSTLIARLALDDLAHERGAVVIDPKGDLVEDLLARIPKGRAEQVDLLDPLDPQPPGLNVLEGSDHDLVVDQLVGIFRRVYERFWGPRTDDILRASLLTLMHAGEGATLADVPKLLTDNRWRRRLVAKAEDPVGLGSFWDWYDTLSEATRAQATGPVLNKLRAFLLRRSVRAIVGQEKSTIDIASVLDRGRLLLVRVPKGTLGEDTSRLLGSFAVARVWQAALARAGRPERWRPDASLYVDEVHNYLSLPTPLAEMLAEARGYRLSLCLAHQHLGQLPKEMREAIAANARTKIFFQLSTEDAHALERTVAPELSAHDLAHLAAHSACVRLCHKGETGAAFTLTTEPLAPGDERRAEQVRASARERAGTPRDEVEEQLKQRHGEPAAEGKDEQALERERERSDSRTEPGQ